MCGRLYRSAHTPITQLHRLAACSSDTLDTEDTASRPGRKGRGLQRGPRSCHGNGYHNNSTLTGCQAHRRQSTEHRVARTLRVLYTVCVSGSSPGGLRQQQRRGSGSTAHSLSPDNAARLRAAGRTHTPVCFLSRWLCPRRAVIGPHLDTPPLTKWHTAGEHSTDLWGQTVTGR